MAMPAADQRPPASAPPGPGAWQLQLLGGLSLSDGRQRVRRLPSRAAAVLLARLALGGTAAVAREELVELLWPGVEAQPGRHRLRQTLSTLRTLLEAPEREGWPVFEVDRDRIGLLPGSLSCDAVEFERAFRRGDSDAARALYRGDLMPGVFDEWVLDERQRLQALFDRLPPPGPPAARVPPSQVPPARPAPSSAAAAAAGTALLPAYLGHLLGADEQAERLLQAVRDQRLVTALGPGGIGKTRLAVEVAHRLAREASSGFDLCCFVPLATCIDAAQVMDQIQLALRLPDSSAAPLENLVQALNGRQALLLLDNFEQVADDGADLVATLAERLPDLHLLVTSRRVLGLAGECEFVVEALALPATEPTLAEAARNPAVALFVDRARAARADFGLHEGNRDAIVGLVRQLDGLPLAIELAAARVRTLSPQDMQRSLHDAAGGTLALLARPQGARRADHRHASMAAAIDWSWRLLTPPQRELMAALTVPASPFAIESAAPLYAGGTAALGPALDDLVAQSMLRAQPEHHGRARFAMPAPIREFAAATLDTASAARWRALHRAGWQARADTLPAALPLLELRADWPDLTLALQSALDDGVPGQALRLVLTLEWAIEQLRLPQQAIRVLEAAIEGETDAELAAAARNLLAPLLAWSSRFEAALAHLDTAQSQAPPGRPDLRSLALLNAARIRWTRNQMDPDIGALMTQAQAVADGIGFSSRAVTALRARLLGMWGLVAAGRDHDGARAQGLHRQALVLWQAIGEVHMAAKVDYDLALAATWAGWYEDAVARVLPVIAHHREQGHLARISQANNLLGHALSKLRRWPQAMRAYHDAVLAAWEAHAPVEMAWALWNVPQVLLRQGELRAAVRLEACAVELWARHLGPIYPTMPRDRTRLRRIAGRHLSGAERDALAAEGRRLSPAQAVAMVRALTPADSGETEGD